MTQPSHPMFGGRPILIGDTITVGHPKDSEDTTTMRVTGIELVRRDTEVWISGDGEWRNEVIYPNAEAASDSGRYVLGHEPKED